VAINRNASRLHRGRSELWWAKPLSRSHCPCRQAPAAFSQIKSDDFTCTPSPTRSASTPLCHRLLAVRDQLLARARPRRGGQALPRADLFLRDFVIAACGDNSSGFPRAGLPVCGHWYVSTPRPHGDDWRLSSPHHRLLRGVAGHGLVSPACTMPWLRPAPISRVSPADRRYWAIVEDGYDVGVRLPTPGTAPMSHLPKITAARVSLTTAFSLAT